jgi:intracellular septation protein
MRFLIEFAPLIAFFIVYKLYDMITATIVALILTVVGVVWVYYLDKKIPKVQLITAFILLILGSITVFTGNLSFIKMKPTIINLLFSSALFIGLIFKQALLKDIFAEKIPLTDQGWIIFSRRWAYFFLFLALFNEILWRNFSEELWVLFKVFGVLIFSAIFLLSQRKFLEEHKLDKEEL